MSWEPREALYVYLRADPGVQEAVDDRIYHVKPDEGAAKPLIVLWPISRVATRDLGGVAWRQARIQTTTMGTTQLQAESGAKAIVAAVESFQAGMMGGLYVMDAEVVADNQVFFDDIDEVHHHVDVLLTYSARSDANG